MNSTNLRSLSSIQWQPSERLAQLSLDAHIRPWLVGPEILTLRLKAVCGERYALKVVDHWTGLLSGAHKAALKVDDEAGLFRDVEMGCGERVWVFGQTVIPDSTLTLHPWLAELGEAALSEMLSALSGVEKGGYEYAWLPTSEAVTARALREAEVKPAGLWARRMRIALRGAPML